MAEDMLSNFLSHFFLDCVCVVFVMISVMILFLFFYFSPPISEFDVFNEGKTQSFTESSQAVMSLCTYLEGIKNNIDELSKNQLFEHFSKLMQVSSIYFLKGIHLKDFQYVSYYSFFLSILHLYLFKLFFLFI